MVVGIDQSKRSTALVLTDEGKLEDFLLVCPSKELDNEDLILYQWELVYRFIYKYCEFIDTINLEGLSFNSVSSSKDLLAGLHWSTRANLKHFLGITANIVPVLSWRAKVLSKEERKSISELKIKDGLKKAVVDKLPFEVKVRFEDYIRECGFKATSLWDLSDAYQLSLYKV